MSGIELNQIENGNGNQPHYKQVPHTENGAIIANPTYDYFNREEKLQGFLSKQFPTIANPAPLGLCGFALTTFVLSLMNAGGLVCKFIVSLSYLLVSHSPPLSSFSHPRS